MGVYDWFRLFGFPVRGLIGALFLGVLGTILTPRSGAAQTSNARYTYSFEDCDSSNEAQLRDELNRLAQKAIVIDPDSVKRIVDLQWAQSRMGELIDREVDRAVDEVSQDENYLSRLWSTWSPGKARELARRVADRTFNSPAFQEAMGSYSLVISDDLVAELKVASERSASAALRCMNAHIEGKYSRSLVELFNGALNEEFGSGDFGGTAPVTPSIVAEHTRAFGGLGVIVGAYLGRSLVRRLVAGLTKRIAGRIAGRAIGRGAASILPVVGWVLGAGLIVWDLVEGGRGVFPQIEKALKAEEAKLSIRKQIATVSLEELERELPGIARQLAEDLFAAWQKLKQQIQQLLRLAEENTDFKRILKQVPTNRIGGLSEQVDLYIELFGRNGLNESLANGGFEKFFSLPDGAIEVLRESKSEQTVFAWIKLSGEAFRNVVELEIFRYRDPESITEDELKVLVALDDKELVADLLVFETDIAEALLRLPSTHLASFGKVYEQEDLRWLGLYLKELRPESRRYLISRLRAKPDLIGRLANENKKRLILASSDSKEMLQSMLKDRDFTQVLSELRKVFSGELGFDVFWTKYGTPKNIIVTISCLIVMWILFFRRSSKGRA